MRYPLLILLLVFSAAVQCEDLFPQREAVPRSGCVSATCRRKTPITGFLWLTDWWMS